MGSAQSQEQPKVVRIDRNEIPDEYKTVGVSSDVVKRVNAQNPEDGQLGAERAKNEQLRETNERLRQEMAQLSALQQRLASDGSAPVRTSAASDIEERKRVFDETVERVQQQFFQYHRENVCQDNEQQIMDCLKSNPGRVLKCSGLVDVYEKCVADFRQQVLNGH